MLVLSYKKLFKKLIDIDMQHNELMNKAKVSRSTFYKLKNGENVNTQTLLRICNALKCDISDIVECVESQKGYENGKN
jgi:DNA-binding Xre family transcriptional regulator